jgi:hypothetical protein
MPPPRVRFICSKLRLTCKCSDRCKANCTARCYAWGSPNRIALAQQHLAGGLSVLQRYLHQSVPARYLTPDVTLGHPFSGVRRGGASCSSRSFSARHPAAENSGASMPETFCAPGLRSRMFCPSHLTVSPSTATSERQAMMVRQARVSSRHVNRFCANRNLQDLCSDVARFAACERNST